METKSISRVLPEHGTMSKKETGEHRELYSKPFFELQLRFAEKVARIAGIGLRDAVIGYSALANLAAQEDRLHEKEVLDEAFEKSLQTGADLASIFYQKYKDGLEKDETQPGKYFGCFSYEYDEKQRMVRPHFKNRCEKGVAPFAEEQLPARVNEIGEMLKDILRNHPDAKSFLSSSWLNNRDEYRRFWPESLQRDLHTVSGEYHRMDFWGQFLQKNGGLNKAGETFLERIDRLGSVADLRLAIPYQVQEGECPIRDLYQMYGVM